MNDLDLRRYFNLIKKWLWLLILGMVLAGGAAYVVSINLTPIYEATTTLLLEQSRGTSAITSWLTGGTQWEPLTYAELIPRLLPETAARLGLDRIDPANVTVDAVVDTRVINLRVRDQDPQRAAEIANTIPLIFDEYTQEMVLDRYAESKAELKKELDRLESEIEVTQSRIRAIGVPSTAAQETELSRLEASLSQQRYNYGQLLSAYETVRMSEMQARGNMVVFKEATVPTRPVFPNTRNNTLLATAIGLALALGIALVVEYLDDSIKTPEDVTRALGQMTLGSIARLSTRRGASTNPLVTVTHPRSPISEAFRVLRTNLQFTSVDRPLRRLLVTSPSPSDGKSLLAANLAIVFAQAGQSVVLVDSDLRRPTQHKLFHLYNEAGLTNSLLGQSNPGVNQWLLPAHVDGLRLLVTGPLPPNPAELVGSRRMGEVIEHLADQADVVILDSPPVLAVTDAAVLSQRVDGVLLVLEAGGTGEREARRALAELAQVDAPVLGVVLNKIPMGRRGDYGYYYYRHYYAESSEESTGSKILRRRQRR